MKIKLLINTIYPLLAIVIIALLIHSPSNCVYEAEKYEPIVRKDRIQKVVDNMAVAYRTGNVTEINRSIDYFNLYVNGI